MDNETHHPDIDALALEAMRRSFKPLPLENSASGTLNPTPSFLGQLLCSRRSKREFSREVIPQDKLQRILLDASGGVRQEYEQSGELRFLDRTIPQAGGIYSVDTFLILLRKTGNLHEGIYKLCSCTNSLHILKHGLDQSEILRIMGVSKGSAVEQATAILVLTANFEVKMYKYSKRGLRFALIEVGCALQNALLSACDQDVAAYPQGGFEDEALAKLLKLSFPDEAPIITTILGMPA